MPNIAPDKNQEIAAKKSELALLRKENPQTEYPAFWDELLDKGYLYLYEHLKEMREQTHRNAALSEINKLSFSNLSHITIEAREAIIEKVKNTIPKNPKKIVFLIGVTGSGKSTTLCYLRGDKMVLKNNVYETENNKNNYIGHNDAKSCTFLPNIEVIGDLVVIDFPGLNDTNGTLAAIAVELALKALIAEYSKYDLEVLAFASITNNEGKYAAAAELGSTLGRLIDKREEVCTLGITMYSKDSDFNAIKSLPERQKREISDQYNIAKAELLAGINALNSLITNPNIQVDKQKIQKKIESKELKLQEFEKNYQPSQELLAKYKKELAEHQARIKERENELLKQIRLNKLIRFDDLENQDNLNACIKTLLESPQKSVQINSKLPMDPWHQKLLDDRFKEDLMKELDSGNACGENRFEDFESFKKCIAEHSLIYAIASPEISSFLHLPEMDPNIVKNFDLELIKKCNEKYINTLISLCHILTPIKSFLDKAHETKNVVETKKQIASLENTVRGLLGIPRENDNAWNELKHKHAPDLDSIDKLFKLPKWLSQLSYIPIIKPEIICSFDIKTAHKTMTVETLEKYDLEIKKAAMILDELVNIKRIVSISDKALYEAAIAMFPNKSAPDIKPPPQKDNIPDSNRHAKELRQSEFKAVYEKQLARRRLYTKLVIVSAIIPPLLLITIPFWLLTKHFEKIRMISTSAKEEDEIRSKRRAWKNTQDGLLKIKNNNETKKDISPETTIIKYVDRERYHRDTLFKTKNIEQIARNKIDESQAKSAAILGKIKSNNRRP